MFRRYEKALQAIVAHYPQACSFDPQEVGLASTTFSCRLRDAVSSLIEYNWTSPVDLERLKTIWPELEVTTKAGMVVVRQKGTKALEAVQGPQDVQGDKDNFLCTLDRPIPQQIVACAILIHTKVVNKPVKIKNFPIEEVLNLTKTFDVGVTNDDRGFIIML
jgi:hypothetical protein